MNEMMRTDQLLFIGPLLSLCFAFERNKIIIPTMAAMINMIESTMFLIF